MASSVLLVGGASSSGKSNLTNLIAEELCKNGYKQVVQPVSTGMKGKDWLYLLEGTDKSGNLVRIVVNTASDDIKSINNLDSFLFANSCCKSFS